MISKTYKKYLWLVNTLLQYRKLTLAEIQDKWAKSSLYDGTELSTRTFHQHRNAVTELFDVEVVCDNADGYRYYIKGASAIQRDNASKWLIDSFNVSNIVSEGRTMKDRILLEDIPEGAEYLQLIIEAMKENVELELNYTPFIGSCGVCHVKPFALKVYNRRWYILGYLNEHNGIRNLALDRVEWMNKTDTPFQVPKGFDAKAFYENSVGIYVNEKLTPEKIRIRAFKPHDSYLRSLPLHNTQVEVKGQSAEYTDFCYNLCITPDLINQLLAMGNRIEVLEPQELVTAMKNEILSMAKIYGV